MVFQALFIRYFDDEKSDFLGAKALSASLLFNTFINQLQAANKASVKFEQR